MKHLYLNGQVRAAVAHYVTTNRGKFSPKNFLCSIYDIYTSDAEKYQTFNSKIENESESLENTFKSVATEIGNHICNGMSHDFSEQILYKIKKDRNEIQSFKIGSNSVRMPKRIKGVDIETSLLSREIIFDLGSDTAHLVYNELDNTVSLQDEFGYPTDSAELVEKIGETNYNILVEFCELVMPIANEIPIYDKIEMLTNILNWYSNKYKDIVIAATDILKKLEL
jgi:hypothetical protein